MAGSCRPFLHPLQWVPSQYSTVFALSFDACGRCRLHGVLRRGVLEDLTGELSGDLGVTTRGQSEMKPPLVRAHLIRPGRSPFLAFSQGFLQTTVLRTLNSRTSLSSLDQSFIVSSNQTGEEMGDCSAAKALALRGQHPPPTTDCFITRGS